MRPSSAVMVLVASFTLGLLAVPPGCAGTVAQPASGDAGAGSDAGAQPCDGGTCAAADAGGALRWYATCGDPVCRDPVDAGGADAATCDAVGAPCATRGITCGDGAASCGVVRVCEDHDPRAGGCPISTATLKSGITYVDDAELARLHDETLAVRLATYAYRPEAGDPGVRHLGFVVEDAPESYAVDRGHDRVDLYGYMSMIVAAMQVQEREIRALRGELRQAHAACDGHASPVTPSSDAAPHFTPLR